jgi:hypothetical protein
MEGVETWLSSQAYGNIFPDMTSASFQAVTMLTSSLSMYIFFVYNISFHIVLLTAHRRLFSG